MVLCRWCCVDDVVFVVDVVFDGVYMMLCGWCLIC